ncbi:hypothetical protein FRC12_001189 [Ceratobasidium sp. 428]|nr:hypothetical protein FRC12_001189 [Ceratobasidium sp. 428]
MISLIRNNLATGSRRENGFVWVPESLVAKQDALALGKNGPQKSLLFFRGSCDTVPDKLKANSLVWIKDTIILQDDHIDMATVEGKYVFTRFHMG